MTAVVSFSVDLSALADLEKDAKLLERKVHVGILDDSQNGKTSNAVIAEANEREFGWITGLGTFVPPRSTIRLPIEMREDDIREAAVSELTSIDEEHINNALEAMGSKALEAIKEAFDTNGYGQWQENAESTIQRKKSSQTMVDKGILKEAYSYEVQSE